jgi:hypothetical protein
MKAFIALAAGANDQERFQLSGPRILLTSGPNRGPDRNDGF